MRGNTLAASFQMTPELASSWHAREWDCHLTVLNRLERWADRKLTTFSQSRHEALQTETHGAGSSSGEDSLTVEQESAATVMNANHTLGYIHRSTASRSRKAIITLSSALVRLHLEQSVQFWFPCYKTGTDKPAKIQQRGPRWWEDCST